MPEPFLSEIKIVSFNFPPKGWALCNGQLLPINQNQALFALLGTVYGGNGQTNFALPNLRGRVPVHEGNGHTLGEAAFDSRYGHYSNCYSLQFYSVQTRQIQTVLLLYAGMVPGRQLPVCGSVTLGPDSFTSVGGSAHNNISVLAKLQHRSVGDLPVAKLEETKCRTLVGDILMLRQLPSMVVILESTLRFQKTRFCCQLRNADAATRRDV